MSSPSSPPDTPPREPVDPLTFVDEARTEQLRAYVDELLRATAEFNLTAIRDQDEAWERHVVESLRLVPRIEGSGRLLDVGSGGGLPGMVLAIARPEVQVTLLEATEKKARFLEATGAKVGLSNLTVVCDRAETAGAYDAVLREAFDVVTARAVAPMRVLLEITVPFAKVGGRIVAVKGQRAEVELTEAKHALSKLHVEVEGLERDPTATIVLMRKRGSTPKRYPRRPGEPKRRPL